MADCEDLAEAPNVTLYPYGVNRGLARSWNEGLVNAFAEGADVVIVANDDIAFGEEDLDTLAADALGHPEFGLIWCGGFDFDATTPVESFGFSCLAVNPVAFQTIGCLDENFFPAYCEDQDYVSRARFAGLPERTCTGTRIRHLRGAAVRSSLALSRQSDLTLTRNHGYYLRKWGGGHGEERFRVPFDDPDFDQRIDPEARHAPYGPKYDRTDHEIVQV